MKKIISISLLIIVSLPSILFSQSLSCAETLDYINTFLSKNPSIFDHYPCKEFDYYKYSISKEGLINFQIVNFCSEIIIDTPK